MGIGTKVPKQRSAEGVLLADGTISVNRPQAGGALFRRSLDGCSFCQLTSDGNESPLVELHRTFSRRSSLCANTQTE